VSQHLSFFISRKAFRSMPGSERYSGNPTVADRRGACGNVDVARAAVLSRPIEGIRRDTVHPDVRMVGLEVCKQAQGEVLFGGIRGIGGWFGRSLGFGGLGLFERFFPPIPGAEFRSRLIEDKAHGHGDCRRHH